VTTAFLTRPTRAHDPGLHRRITVGAHDGSGSASAIAWATAEAHRTAAQLTVVECFGAVPDRLLALSLRSDLLVLGRGSDALTDASPVVVDVVARATRPVAVIPPAWTSRDVAAAAPIVLGLPDLGPDGHEVPMRALSYALVSARRRGTGLHVVASWRPFLVGSTRARALQTFRCRERIALEALRTMTEVYPEVPVRVSLPVTDLRTELVRLSGQARAVLLPRTPDLAVGCLPLVAGPLVVVP
jgi:hypothetical protein